MMGGDRVIAKDQGSGETGDDRRSYDGGQSGDCGRLKLECNRVVAVDQILGGQSSDGIRSRGEGNRVVASGTAVNVEVS